MSPEQAARHIEIEGLEQLKAALAKGKGAIILLAHMGPWEALTQLPQFAKSHGIHASFGAMYRPLSVKTLAPTRWQFKLRPVPVAPETDLTSREALAALCKAIADSLAESPLDGFWLHDRF